MPFLFRFGYSAVVAEIVVVESALLCVADALAVVDRTDDWLVIWTTILASIRIRFELVALEFLFQEAQATGLIEEREWITIPDILDTQACIWISLALARLGVIGVFREIVRAGQTVRVGARIAIVVSAHMITVIPLLVDISLFLLWNIWSGFVDRTTVDNISTVGIISGIMSE